MLLHGKKDPAPRVGTGFKCVIVRVLLRGVGAISTFRGTPGSSGDFPLELSEPLRPPQGLQFFHEPMKRQSEKLAVAV